MLQRVHRLLSFSSLTMSTVSALNRPSYFDVQSTTQIDPRVLDKMLPYMISEYGNPHSKTHSYGSKASEAIETARSHVASLISADPREIIFTSGATESNNAAIKGVAKFYAQKNKKKIITTQTDHKCVLDSCRHLQEEGFTVEYLKVDTNGIISLEQLANAIDETTSLVSIMAVNNEIGVIQPLEAIGTLCRDRKVLFHTDAAQAVGKITLDVDRMKIDLLSISGHKIYGPKGVGALYIRRKPRVRLVPLINGGGQERGLRSGTLPPALVVGLGEACRLSLSEMESEGNYLCYLSRKFIERVECEIPEVVLNGHREQRIPGNLNYSFAYVEGESLMTSLRGLAVSSGSACTSDSLEPSYVLRAIGVNEELAHTSLRIGLGRFTTESEVDSAVDQIKSVVEKLRELSPLYEMAKEGIDISTIEWNQPH